MKWPIPKHVKEVRSYLGFTGYFRRLLQDYVKNARPLNDWLVGHCTSKTSADAQEGHFANAVVIRGICTEMLLQGFSCLFFVSFILLIQCLMRVAQLVIRNYILALGNTKQICTYLHTIKE